MSVNHISRHLNSFAPIIKVATVSCLQLFVGAKLQIKKKIGVILKPLSKWYPMSFTITANFNYLVYTRNINWWGLLNGDGASCKNQTVDLDLYRSTELEPLFVMFQSKRHWILGKCRFGYKFTSQDLSRTLYFTLHIIWIQSLDWFQNSDWGILFRSISTVMFGVSG